MTTFTALFIVILLFIFIAFNKQKKRINKREIFDKDGKLTQEAQFIIQKIVRDNDTF